MALKHFVLGGKNIAYSDTGSGSETVILLHCSGSSHRIFKHIIESLSEQFRVLAPDLAGYGASEAWSENESFHYQYDIDLVQRLIALCRTPVHIIGYSYGGLLALEVAPGCDALRSMLLMEPAALQILRESDHSRLDREVETVGARVVKSAKARQMRRAAATYMSYWGGYWRWLLMSRDAKNRVQNTVHKAAMEFESVFSEASHLDYYRKVSCPVMLVGGNQTRDAAKAIIQILEQTLPKVETRWLKGASHLTLLRQTNIREIIDQWLLKVSNITTPRTEKAVENATV